MLAMLAWLSLWLALAAGAVLLVILAVARRARKSALADSVVRQEQGENLTEAVIDYVEGMGIIKAYNLLGAKSSELTGNFDRSRDESIAFERRQMAWQSLLFVLYVVGSVAVLFVALALRDAGLDRDRKSVV